MSRRKRKRERRSSCERFPRNYPKQPDGWKNGVPQKKAVLRKNPLEGSPVAARTRPRIHFEFFSAPKAHFRHVRSRLCGRDHRLRRAETDCEQSTDAASFDATEY